MDGLYLPIFQYIAAVNFVQQFVQTDSALSYAELHWAFVKAKSELLQ